MLLVRQPRRAGEQRLPALGSRHLADGSATDVARGTATSGGIERLHAAQREPRRLRSRKSLRSASPDACEGPALRLARPRRGAAGRRRVGGSSGRRAAARPLPRARPSLDLRRRSGCRRTSVPQRAVEHANTCTRSTAPSGYAVSANYRLADDGSSRTSLGRAARRATSTSSDTQYYDGSGHVVQLALRGLGLRHESAAGERVRRLRSSACLTDAQLQADDHAREAANGWQSTRRRESSCSRRSDRQLRHRRPTGATFLSRATEPVRLGRRSDRPRLPPLELAGSDQIGHVRPGRVRGQTPDRFRKRGCHGPGMLVPAVA